eukprot:TRINITY_DN4030_c0_g1_i1.p1 TRINITY_DN4030_c0_g1~~TRINITY_DN4030_c0_g1_i1.p1  ORF type:complete len:183 (+),score=65.72 TRINITY_DN4030_c0_g1_i1:347-895(+)
MRSLLLVALAVCCAGELKIPQMPRKISRLDRQALGRYLRDLGYDPTERENGSAYLTVLDDNGGKKIIDMAWSDHDTLVLRSAWNSPHTELGDLPIVNTWNQRYRFAKVSIQDNTSDEPGNTVMIMHMDQFLPTDSGEDMVKDIVKRSIEIYKISMLAFDKFVIEVYTQAQKKQKEKEEGEQY